MLELSLAEQITLVLYIVTSTLLLVALLARHELSRRLASLLVVPVGAAAALALFGFLTGQTASWLDRSGGRVAQAVAVPESGALHGQTSNPARAARERRPSRVE